MIGAKFLRRIFETEPMARYVVGEYMPGKDVRSDDEWRAFIRATAIGIYHPAGTCKMGVDEMAVVDPQCWVRGIDGLRVADSSIMPRLISSNTNAPSIMIGEKAADLVKGNRAVPLAA